MFNNNPDFYPTPKSLINKMLSKIDFKFVSSCLEPSAGKGDIVEAIINKFKCVHSYSYNKEAIWDIDVIEINSDLQHILRGKGHRVVADDYLSYNTYKRYDAIIANFPFSQDEKHLLHALEMQKQGGQICCIINAETIRNPYSNPRKELLTKLEYYNAEIEYIQNAFYDADRKTDVEIALIYISIPKSENDSIILGNLKQQEEKRVRIDSQNKYTNQMVNADFIKGIVEQYNFEVQTGLKLISEYEALKPLMLNSFDDDYSKNPILELVLHYKDDDGNCSLANSYIKQTRTKYWKALFTNKDFMGLFTTNLREKYMNKINELRNYDFSLFNIYEIRIQLSKEMLQGVEDTIMKLFDEFSYQSSWDKEFGNNIHYYSGWSTNKCWKINEKKVIIRLNGWGYWGERLDYTYKVFDKLSDIEKVYNYLSNGIDMEIKEINMKDALKFAQDYGKTKKIELQYFYVTFYKKGTCHLEWKYPELVHRFNIFAGQKGNNLPPSYGKKTYNEMDEEEQAVIKEFEGELSYTKVMNNTQNYILETSQLLMLA